MDFAGRRELKDFEMNRVCAAGTEAFSWSRRTGLV